MSGPSSSQASLQQLKDTVRDISLWRRRKLSAAAVVLATLLWVLMEIYQFHFVTLVSWAALVLVTSVFLWANLLRLFSKEAPNLSGLELSEGAVEEAGNTARVLGEEGLKWMFHISAKQQLFGSLAAVVALWFLSYIGSLFDFPTFLYIGSLMGMAGPPLYVRYEENLRRLGGRLRAEGTKLYDVVHTRVIEKVDTNLVQETKEKKQA